MRISVSGLPNVVRRFTRSEDGATAIEYALIAVILGVGVVTGLEMTGSSLDDVWAQSINSEIEDALDGGDGG